MSELRIGFVRENARAIIRRMAITQPPVDVDAIAKSVPLEVKRLTSWPDKVSGLLLRDARVIGVNANHTRRRQRFSLAHELGHWFLRHDSDWDDREVSLDSPPEPDKHHQDRESEADEFAGELLVPLAFLKPAFRANAEVSALADLFDVSEQAMWVRVLRHRLI